MRIDNLQQFVNLRRQLCQERDQLSQRLNEINEALGELSTAAPEAGASSREAHQPQAAPAITGGRAGSLREHVIEVLRGGAMTSREVLDAVQKRGYKFSTNNPLNSLGVILYGKNPKFNRADGKFSLGGGSHVGNGMKAGGESNKRQLSPAARARIAEAQRRRWAATRKAQGNNGASAAKPTASGAGKRTFSPAARKAIAEAARRRWAAAKKAGKNRL